MIQGIYFVTDAEADQSVETQVRAALKAGVRAIQLRDKTATDADMVSTAKNLQPLVRKLGGTFIVNDRIDVALSCGADGLHIGQGDGDVASIRARIGQDMILGLSVEHPDHLAAIPPDCVDYIGVGPVHATSTKPDHAPPIGFDGLSQIAAAAPCLTVAIGGLGTADVQPVHKTGCVGMAVVSAISRAANIQDAAANLVTNWSKA